MVYLQTTYELCFGEGYFEYFESCDFSTNKSDGCQKDMNDYLFLIFKGEVE
jgi:hypothetical protein